MTDASLTHEQAVALAEAFDGKPAVVSFMKADGRVRKERGVLEYQPDKSRVRVDKGSGGYRLVGLASVTAIGADGN